MQKLKRMITEAGYGASLGRAVAMSAGYFAKEEGQNPKKSYTVQETKDFMEFLFDVRTKELNAKTDAALQALIKPDERGEPKKMPRAISSSIRAVNKTFTM